MLPRRERLPRGEFPALLTSGRRLSSAHFTAVFSGENRGYAVVVPKKVAHLSVTRHRIKRRILAALRTLPLPPSLIIFPQPSAGSVSYEDTRAEMAELLANITRHTKARL
ncbi:ribonuclease P protein component [Candidatus Kaiserbacteria bacterium]|nr:ribonuclease P protein component [Candidatus Kaiserbacteria bacterium]